MANGFAPSLMYAPSDEDPLGRPMLWPDLERGLKMANSALIIVKPEQSQYWYPGRAFEGVSLWERPPGTEGARKITTFNLRSAHGAIPEHNQMNSKGLMIARGWKSVLWRVVNTRCATKAAIERIFKLSLDTHEPGKSWCTQCKLNNKFERAYSASGLCEDHEVARKTAAYHRAQKKAVRQEAQWALSKYGTTSPSLPQKTRLFVSRA